MIDTLVDNLDKIKYYNYKSEIANKYNVVLKEIFTLFARYIVNQMWIIRK